ncbi:MAG: hypothetical protein HY821_23630 [Acidobacteria bacterium]|nr:hypothetical protein [Acidobacteriota bacterium]
MQRSAVLCLAVWLAAGVSAQEPALTVGTKKQLFVDYRFIESAEGVKLVMNPPRRTGEVVVTPDAPWEKGLTVASYSTVEGRDGRVRMWYQVSGREHEAGKNPDFMGVAYAESEDGIHFKKPVLGLVERNGSRENNLVLPVDPKLMAIGGGSVMRDENPKCPPEERYKSWQKIYPKPGTGIQGPHRIWVSPDGLRWKLSEKLVTGLHAADTQPTWFWDPRTGRYAGYSREWVQFEGEGKIRMASYNESDDMHAWENMQMVLLPDEADFAAAPRPRFDVTKMTSEREVWSPLRAGAAKERDAEAAAGQDMVPMPGAPLDIYGPGVFPYAEAEGVYVSLMQVFHHWQRQGRGSWPDTGDVRLAVSRDGKHFLAPGGREPFLRLGPAGSFDSKWIWPMVRPVRMGDELWIYYFSTNVAHGGQMDAAAKAEERAISRAVMRLDGFVSADFDYAGGTLITPPLRFEGSRLELNLDTGGGGAGWVEILDEKGRPVPGFSMVEADTLNGNSVRTAVAWKGKTDVSALAGRAVRLHFRMRGAKLYAFQFR